MRTFATYIEYLLMTRHYCYVPGRGAYMLAEEPACHGLHPTIGADSRRVYQLDAPQRVLHFSPLHSHDDGMLANLLMEAEGLSYDEACRYIDRQVPQLSEDFLNAAESITDTDNFGFESLKLETWADIEARMNPRKVAGKPEPKETPALEIHRDSVTIPMYWLRRAAIALLICILFLSNHLGLNQGNVQLASVLNCSMLQRTVLAQQTWDTDYENSVYENPADLVTYYDEPDAALGTPHEAYYIIVGSTRSEDYAYTACKRYLEQGYDQVGILCRDGLYRIFLASYNNREEATLFLRSVRQKGGNYSKTWLFPVKEESLSYIIKNRYNDNQLSLELSHPKQRTERDQGRTDS